MSNPTSPGQVPKAILYTWPTSVWSTVPRLCLLEKGYSDEEYEVKNVDITKGENFAPSYLKINMNGTVPTLVVPTLETTGSEVDTRFRSLRDTVTICDFLDQARSASSSRTVSDKPAPALAPATIEGKATSDNLITLVHQPTVDPNFLHLASSSSSELATKAKGLEGQLLNERKAGLAKYVAEAEKLAEKAGAGKEGRVTYEQKMLAFLQEKQAANELLWQLYNGQSGKEREEAFYTASEKSWTEALPQVLKSLDEGLKGPYALGDQISLADLHIIAWLARIVMLGGGKNDTSGIESLEKRLGGKGIGDKIKAFWAAWLERPSFKRVYNDSLH